MVLKVDLFGDKAMSKDPALLAKFCAALESETCRVTELNLGGNGLGAEGGKAIAEALKVNTSITTINLQGNKLGAEGGKAIAEGLKINTSITNIDVTSNSLDAAAKDTIKAAWNNRTGQLAL